MFPRSLKKVKNMMQLTIDWWPQGFWGSGENGYLYSGSWGALVIILGELGSKLIILGIQGALPKSKKKKYGKASILFDFSKISSASEGLAPTHIPL